MTTIQSIQREIARLEAIPEEQRSRGQHRFLKMLQDQLDSILRRQERQAERTQEYSAQTIPPRSQESRLQLLEEIDELLGQGPEPSLSPEEMAEIEDETWAEARRHRQTSRQK